MRNPEGIDTGDTVRHESTGEEWIVACVRGGYLSWCGWPEGKVPVESCKLIKKATPDERIYNLKQWARPGDHEKARDHRHRYAVNKLKEEGITL